jgi:succinate-semialdehyde dehydrogenase/glutarate-semialdehyde dehydrogenase
MNSSGYPDVQLFINGKWCHAADGRYAPVIDPASGEAIGRYAFAGPVDIEAAAQSTLSGFQVWRRLSALERSNYMRKAANLLRERVDHIATLLTREQGKLLAEAKVEVLASADTIDWFAEEARRTYGRVVPARGSNVRQMVIKEPVGPVAAFTPWNFPITQIARKLGAALAAGCTFLVKAPEETPASPAELVRAFVDAGLPAGTVNLVFGDPQEISTYLIQHPAIRKISFTGSTPVGKHLASLAGLHMKRATMELGGHAPVLVFNDADVSLAAKTMVMAKFRNAGQVCISPTRFLVQSRVFDAFVNEFVQATEAMKVGNGLDAHSNMGPLANERRMAAMHNMVEDACKQGAILRCGGHRIGSQGNFFEPTVLTHVPLSAQAMNTEPFGPLALINPFEEIEDAVKEANRLPFGLAAYAWTTSTKTSHLLSTEIETGMLTINHLGLGLPELPFGGVKDSGYGSEGGSEALEPYLTPKLITHAN